MVYQIGLLLVNPVLGAQGSPQAPVKDPDAAYRMRVGTWHPTAEFVRAKKKQKNVRKGYPMKVADMVATGPKEPISVYAGAISYQYIPPNSAARYASFKPITLDPMKRSEIEVEITKGEIQHRMGPTVFGTLYRSRSALHFAQSAGTAYSVRLVGKEMEVLVAEGEVKVSLRTDPGRALTVGPRQKVLVGRGLPATPTPVTPADEARLRALLSLPISSLIGYTDDEELRRKNAQEIVTLRVRPAFSVEPVGADVPKWRPFSLVDRGNTFWSVDESGARREIGKGLRFVAASKNGTSILGVDASSNLFVQDYLGRSRRLVAPNFVSLVGISPDGERAVGVVQTRRVYTDPKTGKLVDRREQASAILGLRSSSIVSVDAKPPFDPIWRNGGRPLIIVQKDGKITRALVPEAAPGDFMTKEILDRYMPFSKEGDWSLSLSPSGQWLFATLGDRAQIVDLATGRSFETSGATAVSELIGSRVLVTGSPSQVVSRDAQGNVVARPAGPDNVPLTTGLAYRPNGELVTFQDAATRTAIVADSLDLARRSDTYVGFERSMACQWVSGDELLYEVADPKPGEDTLIKLGIKRRGARPRGFGGASPGRPSQGFGFGTDLYPYADELIVSDVASDGTAIGFVKIGQRPAGGFFLDDPRHGSAHSLSSVNGSLLPMSIADDGTIGGSGFAILRDGRYVAVPQSLANQMSLGVDAKGRMLIGESIWDPHATGIEYPVGDGSPYGGKIVPLPFTAPAGTPVAMNRRGTILWVDREGGDKQRFWIAKAGRRPVLAESTIGYSGGIELGADDRVYAQSGTFDRGRVTSMVTRFDLVGEPVRLLKESYGGNLWVRGATKDGVVYGEIGRDVGGGMLVGDRGFVILDGEVVELNDLLPSGYKVSSIRRINDQGDVAGEFTKDGKPVGYVPNLRVLLANRRGR